MSVLVRITDFVPSTLIKSQEMDDELNQLVNLLSGVSTNKDTLLKFSDGTNPVLRVDQLGAGLIQQWLNNGTARASMSALGKLLLPAGIGATPSTDQISNFGTYFVDPNQFATGANTNETDFSSKTVAANVFANISDFMLILANFSYAANGNTKRVRLYFGGTVIYDTTAAAANGIDHNLLLFMFRNAGSSLYVASMSNFSGASPIASASFTTSSPTFSNSNILKTTAQNGTAAANDIVQRMFIAVKGSV